ncbi:hypothetical protein [Paraburkholderia azotifigens]|uniref:Uncharacterized protein n=1 Tax=Paraburkholderia azotifigens TaxID=2057004 RepID=A0ABU9R3T8_9BURK
MSQYSEFEFRTQPWFDPAWFDQSNFQGFSHFIPMKTIVIHCFDPRASEIPQAVADYFEDEVYPGENILDEAGNRIGNTRTLFAVSNAGGARPFGSAVGRNDGLSLQGSKRRGGASLILRRNGFHA